MTREAIEEGRKILCEIERIKDVREKIRPYIHEHTEVKVLVRKEVRLEFDMFSDDPVFLAVDSTLQDMLEELEGRLSDLNSNSNEELNGPAVRRLSVWEKVWSIFRR